MFVRGMEVRPRRALEAFWMCEQTWERLTSDMLVAAVWARDGDCGRRGGGWWCFAQSLGKSFYRSGNWNAWERSEGLQCKECNAECYVQGLGFAILTAVKMSLILGSADGNFLMLRST